MSMLWIETDAPHCRIVDLAKFDTIYSQSKGYGKWAVIGSFGSSDIWLKTFPTEREAAQWIAAMMLQLQKL